MPHEPKKNPVSRTAGSLSSTRRPIMTRLPAELTAAILAGGLGTRLRSVVHDQPKVLAQVHGRPFLTYLLDQLAHQGIRKVVLLTGYLASQVHENLGEHYAGLALA
jgi:D-glycero-alpha-D-manno-heptose 1-phosphate guanylyltransferase